MLQTHDYAAFGAAGYKQIFRHRVIDNSQGMISGGPKGFRDVFEYQAVVVFNFTSLPVH